MSKTLVVILARAGSVRLPRKNVAPFLGRPMISWTYERALALRQAGLADDVAVSSDDADVLRLAPHGIETIERPADLATSTATSFDAMSHAVRHIEERQGLFDLLVLLQPTSPLASDASTAAVVARARESSSQGRDDAHIAIASLSEADADIAAVLPEWRLKAKGTGVRGIGGRQSGHHWPFERVADDLATHTVTGATYAITRAAYFEAQGYFPPPPRAVGVVVPAWEAIDIDTHDDFAVALAIGNLRAKALMHIASGSSPGRELRPI